MSNILGSIYITGVQALEIHHGKYVTYGKWLFSAFVPLVFFVILLHIYFIYGGIFIQSHDCILMFHAGISHREQCLSLLLAK